MEVPTPDELIERVNALPAAEPLIPRVREKAGVYLVGGAVRDVLLGGTPYDLDLVVEGDAVELARSLGGAVRFHDRFGTSTVILDGRSYDIVRARRESYPEPGALPRISPGSLADDLSRRDFTVNAIAIALGGAERGRLSSAPGALEDLEAGLLRVLHDASFTDDPTRLMRLVRYASRLGFEIEPHTRQLAKEAVGERALTTISGSRLGAELRLLAREPDPVSALAGLAPLGLDRAIHPGFALADEELARRALRLLGDHGRRDLLALAVAARDVPADELAALLSRLAFEAGDRDTVLAAATRAHELARALGGASSPSEIARAVGSASPELVALAGALESASPELVPPTGGLGAAGAAKAWLERLRHVRLAIDGDDVLAAGVPRGPAVGRALRAALEAKLDGRVDGRDEELAEALRASGASG